MATTFRRITRKQFEDWLFTLCPVFDRVEGTKGIYLVPMSKYVAVKISSSIGTGSKVVEKGKGSCHMSFVVRDTGRQLRRPKDAKGVSYRMCHRTKGWEKNWGDALKLMFEGFKADRDAYTADAMRSQKDYAKEWKARIKSVDGWRRIDILADLHKKLVAGEWLSPRQESAIWKFVRPVAKKSTRKKTAKKAAKRAASGTPMGAVKKLTSRDQQALLTALDKLEAEATTAKDKWTIDFASGSLRARVKAGKAPTKRQAETLRKKLARYKIYVPSSIAA